MPTSLTPTRSKVSAWSGYLDRRTEAGSSATVKVIIEKSRGEVFPLEQDTIENVSKPITNSKCFFLKSFIYL